MSGDEAPGIRSDPATELTGSISKTVEALFSEGSVADTLAQLVGLAVVTIEACDFAGLFVSEHGQRRHAVLDRSDRDRARYPPTTY